MPNIVLANDLRFIPNRSELASNDFVDWRAVGPIFSAVTNPFFVMSSNGIGVTVSKSSGEFSITEQTSASDGPFSANFAPGDALISTTGETSGAVTITFSSPIIGVGTQVEAFGNGVFYAVIEALDSFGKSLGSFRVKGLAKYGGTGDNTAPFVGVINHSANIASIRITALRRGRVGFAFNRLDIVSQINSHIDLKQTHGISEIPDKGKATSDIS
ncbi:hypothetical protein WKK05_08305 [Nostoc sp. UHCC 0302]|uniref:hypothetical protein n=1 Tax=Nostoc sp. UHCC 0302 TaxID=3134896 RepID=UPI00311CA25B